MTDVVIVTGAAGGVGSAVVRTLRDRKYRVIGIDVADVYEPGKDSLKIDLSSLNSTAGVDELSEQLAEAINADRLVGLVNNAALQIVCPFNELTVEHVINSLQVNCVAPFVLAKASFDHLKKSHGTIVNIGSIHSKLTKPGFVAYATSKSAIEGLTRAMAVELGGDIKVCAIVPAAIATPMLTAGFENNPQGLNELNSFHPAGIVGSINEVGKMVSLLIGDSLPFSNGALWNLDGGISGVLHDPG
ncbi:SDR family NAD(P)-dependent oxidoreductase [Luminiphilus sp. nBUS_07]|uniref:SDR family NAD(P)-dependent oxidoreductase n=1 Tax=Luminiphilus sp. nBUS_07 TaxID=3395314 RepID=UPI003EBC058F